MKNLCITLGLLLITVSCCNAIPQGVKDTQPASCCFDFSTTKVPQKHVNSVMKTHSACLNKAFIVHTVRGRQICYRQTFQWAVTSYNRLHNTKSSSEKLL